MFTSIKSKQARKPSGIIGRLIMPFFFEKGNAELNNFMCEIISVNENDHILEIGFGPGVLIKQFAQKLNHGIIEGIDISKSMVASAKKRNRNFIYSGNVQLHHGNIETYNFEASYFNTVFTINTVYFWEKPEAIIEKVSNMTKIGGKFFIGFHEQSELEKLSLDSSIFRYYSKDDIHKILTHNGAFGNIKIIEKRGKNSLCHCAYGTKK